VRDSVQQLRLLPIVTPDGARIALADVADVKVVDGPPVIKSENARLNGWTYVDIKDRDLGSYVAEAQRIVAENIELPAGYSLAWSGQYEYMVRAQERLAVVGPVTLAVIVLLLFINFGRLAEVAIVMGTRSLAAVPARLRIIGRGRRGLHCIGRCRRRDRGRHARVPESGHATNIGGDEGRRRTGCHRRCAVAYTSGDHDGRSDDRWPAADHVRQRNGVGSDATYCCTDGGWHGQRNDIDACRDSSVVPVVAAKGIIGAASPAIAIRRPCPE
jgi:hypothetical protein